MQPDLAVARLLIRGVKSHGMRMNQDFENILKLFKRQEFIRAKRGHAVIISILVCDYTVTCANMVVD